MFISSSRKSFTLIEILIVVSIIGLLLAIGFAGIPIMTSRTRITKSLKFSQTIHNSIGVDLVASWSGDEGTNRTCESKDICDQSSYSNHGVNHGVSWDTDTPSGENYSLSFDGSGDYIVVDSATSLNLTNKTIEVWIRTNQDDTAIIGQKDSFGKWALVIRNNHIMYIDIVTGSSIEGKKVVTDGQWHHVVVVAPISGSGNVIYIDSKVDFREIMDNVASNGSIYIGSCSNIAEGLCRNSYYSGKLDNIRIYNRAMNATEIEQNYVKNSGKYLVSSK